MNEQTSLENQALLEFWSAVFTIPEEEKEAARQDPGSWEELCPSEKLLRAVCAFGGRKNVLDYGCGNGWAAIAAAKNGCNAVTAVDAAPNAAEAARFCASLFDAEDQVHAGCVSGDWLCSVPAKTYDGFICCNVLDTVPPETAEAILREAARVVTPDADILIGLNNHLTPEAAAEKGIELVDGCRVYLDGILRLVSRTDEEWAERFSPYFTVEQLEYYAWPGETEETRRLFRLRRR